MAPLGTPPKQLQYIANQRRPRGVLVKEKRARGPPNLVNSESTWAMGVGGRGGSQSIRRPLWQG
eukprot:1221201-Heterocapsa_arctica.AAC.1